jgi:sialidase-1
MSNQIQPPMERQSRLPSKGGRTTPGSSPGWPARAVASFLVLTGTLLADPLFEKTDVYSAGQDGYFAYRIPALEVAPDGSLLAFAEARKHNLNDPGFKGQDIDLVLKRSTDQGATWSPLKVIEDPGEQWSAANPATLADRQTGRVWLFYLRGKPGRNTYSARPGTDDIQILARTSGDNGLTWSEPADLTAVTRDLADPKWHCTVAGPGGAICARDGRLVVPMWRFEPWGVFAAFSEDHGLTWQRGEFVPGVSGDECQLVELADGQLLFDIRQQRGPHRWRATSGDGGRTWSKPYAGEKVTPVCCAIERYSLKSAGDDRDRLLWTGPKGPGRSNLVVRVSDDEGRTFSKERPIATGPAAYSDLAILKDKSVGVLWERGADRGYQFITFTRFDREWLESPGKNSQRNERSQLNSPNVPLTPSLSPSEEERVAEGRVRGHSDISLISNSIRSRFGESDEAGKAGRMQLLSKEVFIRHRDHRAPAAGFVSYVGKTQPVLMHCHGWEDFSDGYDDYAVSVSEDNGRTWSPEEVRWKSVATPAGRIRYGEPAAFFDAEKEKLIVLVDKILYPKDKLNVDGDYALTMDVYDPKERRWSERRELKFPGQRTPAMSFSFPIKTSRGHLLFPGSRSTVDATGKVIHYRKSWAPVAEVVTVRGAYGPGDDIAWSLGQPLNISANLSSRGLNENTLTELPDGRIAAVCRGDNSQFPEKPGYKWLSFSTDDGKSWFEPAPLPATDGDPFESGSNGSALFRSIKNGKLYWMGNLALGGERAKGNWPRAPLVIVEVREEPFQLERDTVFAVDERTFNDSPRVQLSNFRFYQDRATGDVVVFLTRYGEQSEKEWMLADYYRYRVRMP